MTSPNSYVLSGRHVHVTYTTEHAGPDRPDLTPPFVTYRDAVRTLSFQGEQVELVQSGAGRLVTVIIVATPDLGDTTFSFLLPEVNLPDQGMSSAPIRSLGITAFHRASLAPALDHGQLDTYSAVALAGTASFIALR